MGIFGRKKREIRADTAEGTVGFEDALLKALLGGGNATKEMALQVPAVSGGLDLVAGIVAGTPIKLYRDEGGKAHEVHDDPRIRILNDETGDTLNANEFWRAITRDYFLGKGGYAYIHKVRGEWKSIHYVDEEQISIQKNTDPIFKDFNILVQGVAYKPFQFLKILRNTKDGAQGQSIIQENPKLIEVAYESMRFELNVAKRGGNKRGFLKTPRPLDKNALDELRSSFSRMYSNEDECMVILRNGLEFQESSATAMEMQLNENKASNAAEFAKIFHVPTSAMEGRATEADTASLAKLAAIPLMTAIQCALNKDFLLEKEKGALYWAFDTKELLKGDMRQRFQAYKTALDANFMQIDEVRYAEDMEPLGLSWVKLGLQDVLYDPETKMIYTPNTNQTSTMGENPLPTPGPSGILEARAREYKRDGRGRFAGSVGSGASSGEASGSQQSKEANEYVEKAIQSYAANPKTLGDSTPQEKYNDFQEHGVQLQPLGRGSQKGKAFSDGGGYKANDGKDGLFSYHPDEGSHHGGEYYKLSSGKLGVQRYDMNGDPTSK